MQEDKFDDIDWNNMLQVIAYAQHLADLGKCGMIVLGYKGKQNYNIVHKSREDIWKNAIVLYDTDNTDEVEGETNA